jgi:hypothetical protein
MMIPSGRPPLLENALTVVNSITTPSLHSGASPMTPRINIAKRIRKRRRADGSVAVQVRYVVDFRDPATGKRCQFFFERRKDAEAKRAELVTEMATGLYSSPTSATVEIAMQNWLSDREPKVKRVTFVTYERAARYVCGPVLVESVVAHPGLGKIRLTNLQTAEIRRWINALRGPVGHYSANRAMAMLKTVSNG